MRVLHWHPLSCCIPLLLLLAAEEANAFTLRPLTSQSSNFASSSSCLSASGQGFGKNSRPPPNKTYGSDARVIKDMIDSQEAMASFFNAREDWFPLFRSVATDASCLAMEYLETLESTIDFHESSEPWRLLQAIPDKEEDKQVLAGFLDAMHQSLIDIPVTDSKTDDENDLQFVEEGRRLLAISRFHVVRDAKGGGIDSYDKLFSTCWSELMQLRSSDVEHSGSIILVPDYELSDLRRFTDMNLIRPLEWLGLERDFEVASLQRGSPAIRLLYKLRDIPEDSYNEDEETQDEEEEKA
jgi:hypothetical protein